MNTIRSRSIAARAGLVLGIAALVVAGGLLAGLRGGEGSPATQAAPSAVRATLDPVTSLTGDAAQVERAPEPAAAAPGQRPARRARSASPTCSARGRRTTRRTTRRRRRCSGQSLKRDPAGLDATIGAGSLALSYHDFRDALRLGQRALTLSNGFSPAALGMIGDASVELGRYQQGFDAFAQLGELRPGLVAYARLSYSRELVGDVEGATRLMRARRRRRARARPRTRSGRACNSRRCCSSRATSTRPPGSTATRSRCCPSYARAEAGLGAVAVARGNLAQAEQWYDRAASHLPLPDIVAQLGDVRAARGDAAGASEAYALVRLEQALFVRSGGNADLETALFEASHPGARSRASVVALARKALASRPSIYGHDSLAWALYSAGKCRQALPQAMLANRLGTIDPELSWHLGAIAACAGKPGVARAALDEGARAESALPPARRPGGAAAAGDSSDDRRPSGTRCECQLALSASLAVAAVALVVLVPAAEAHPLGNFTVNQYTRLDVAPARRLGALRARHGRDPDVPAPAGRRRERRRAHRGRGERARARPARRARGAASAAARSTASPCGSRCETARVAFPQGQGGLKTTRLDARFRAVGLALGAAPQHAEARRTPTRPTASAGASCWSPAARASRCARPTPRPAICTKALTAYPTDLLHSPPDVRSATTVAALGSGGLAVQAIPARDAYAPGHGLQLGQGRRRLRLADRERRRADAVRRARGARARARVRDVPRAHAGPRQDDGRGVPRRARADRRAMR